MKPLVSIIMGSTSDWMVMEGAANFLNEIQIPFEIEALSAHRTPEKVNEFSRTAQARGIKVIIAGAGMAAHLPGVIASCTGYWSSCKSFARGIGCSAFDDSNASGNPCSYCRNRCIPQCCYTRRSDHCAFRS